MKSMYASRSVPVLNTPVPNAAYVDDSSSQNESLQRKADMANGSVQRVVQRETGVVQRVGEADGKFKYVNYDQKRGVDFAPGYICFSEYQNGGTKSDGFNGCMMMAFRFNCEKNENEQIASLWSGEKPPFIVTRDDLFIAHVHSDQKVALKDAEERDLIKIEVLYKPWTPRDQNNIIEEVKKQKMTSEERSFISQNVCFTGALTNNIYGWSADIFVPKLKKTSTSVDESGKKDKTYNFDIYKMIKNKYPKKHGRSDQEKRIIHYDDSDLFDQTVASRAYLYASCIAKKASEEKQNFNDTDKLKNLDPFAWDSLKLISEKFQYAVQLAEELAGTKNEIEILQHFEK